MERSRRIVLVAHCILNQNARAQGLAKHPGAHPLAMALAERGYGLVQLPCPELAAAGASRGRRPAEEYDTTEYRTRSAESAAPFAEQVEEYLSAGYEVAAVVGVDGSPSCGVTLTSTAAGGATARVSGEGVFTRALRRVLEPLGVPFVAVDSRVPDGGVSAVLRSLDAR